MDRREQRRRIGRVISALIAPAIASVEFARTSDLHLFDDGGTPARVVAPRSLGIISSATAVGPCPARAAAFARARRTPSGVSACDRVSASTRPCTYRAARRSMREGNVAAHRQAADHRLLRGEASRADRSRRRHSRPPTARRIAAPPSKPRSCRSDHMPAGVGEAELPFEHPRVQRKRVQQQQRAARSSRPSRRRFEIAESSDIGHAHCR